MGINEVKDFDEELEKIMKEIEITLKEPERVEISHVKKRIKRAKESLRSFKIEIRELPSSEQASYQLKVKIYHTKIDQFIQISDNLMISEKKNDLGHLDTVESEQILKEAKQIQVKDLSNLDRIIKQTEESKSVAVNIGIELKKNTESLSKTEEGLNEVESHIKMGRKELSSFARRVATDKITLTLACLIFLGIIAIIIYFSVKSSLD